MSVGSSRLIQASAGTGKTYALSGQFISLLIAGEDPSSILASTFTRKAAGEILERIYLRLARAILESNAREQLREQLQLKSLSCHKIEEALTALISNQQQIKVSTLDSFASNVARLFTEELGLPSNWTIEDQASSELQLSYSIAAVCSSLKSIDVASLVTALKRGESSRSISNAINTIVAGLLGIFQETDFSAWNWLNTKRPSLNAQKSLLETLKNVELPKTKAGTINQKILSAFQNIILAIENEDWAEVLESTLLQKACQESATFASTPLNESLIGVMREASVIATQNCLAKLADANRAAYGLLLAVVNELKASEDRSGKISFERIVRRLVQFGHSLFSNELYFRLDTRIHHVLLDEFQDTSLLQWQLLEPLIDEKLSSIEVTSSFFCVGDGKQAIYGWREGNTAIFDSIPKRWSQIEVQTLETSYRSAPPIIEVVNTVFGSLKENPLLDELRPAVNNWLARFNQHSTVILDQKPVNLDKNFKDSIHFEAIKAEPDSEDYGAYLFAKLKQITSQNPNSSVGILVRGNKDISQILDLAQTHNYELSTQGGTPLTRFPLITALLSILSLIDNPGDTIKEHEVLSSPWGREGNLTKLINDTKESLQRIGLAQSLQNLCNRYSKIYSCSEQRAIDQLSYLAIREELSNSNYSLQTFISIVENSAVEDVRNAQTQVLTIHKSKGLEFDIIVIPDLSWNLKPKDNPNYLVERDPFSLLPVKVSLPDKQSLRSFSPELSAMAQQKYNSDFEESLSLLYVALTRAKSSMHLLTPQSALNGKNISAASLIAFKIPPIEEEISRLESPSPMGREEQRIEHPRPIAEGLSSVTTSPLKNSSYKQRGLGRISPSSFIQHEQTSNSNNDNELFGTLIHKLFSITEWKEQCWEEATLLNSLQQFGACEDQVVQAVTAFKRYLSLDSVSTMLQSPAAADLAKTKVYTEKSFVYREGNALIQGRIDRLVVGPISGMIVDFKVGKTPDSQRLAGYMNQLKAYQKAASLLFPAVKFEAVLLFLGDGNMVVLKES